MYFVPRSMKPSRFIHTPFHHKLFTRCHHDYQPSARPRCRRRASPAPSSPRPAPSSPRRPAQASTSPTTDQAQPLTSRTDRPPRQPRPPASSSPSTDATARSRGAPPHAGPETPPSASLTGTGTAPRRPGAGSRRRSTSCTRARTRRTISGRCLAASRLETSTPPTISAPSRWQSGAAGGARATTMSSTRWASVPSTCTR